jgi:hypothetical protein
MKSSENENLLEFSRLIEFHLDPVETILYPADARTFKVRAASLWRPRWTTSRPGRTA